MFIRKKLNSSGSISVQVIQKIQGRNKIHKVLGSATTQQEIEKLVNLARQEIERLTAQPKLFNSESDAAIEQAFCHLSNSNIRTLGPDVVENYKNLWYIEKAFRMSKTDLRIRPIYHRLRNRIEAHICVSFTAYCIYKELERVLYAEKSSLSLKKAAELTHNMYQITYTLPDSKHTKSRLLKMDNEQEELYQMIKKNF